VIDGTAIVSRTEGIERIEATIAARSADGRRAALVRDDEETRLAFGEVGTGGPFDWRSMPRSVEVAYPVEDLAFSPDGQMLAAACAGAIQIFDAHDGRLLDTLRDSFRPHRNFEHVDEIGFSRKADRLFVHGSGHHNFGLTEPTYAASVYSVDEQRVLGGIVFTGEDSDQKLTGLVPGGYTAQLHRGGPGPGPTIPEVDTETTVRKMLGPLPLGSYLDRNDRLRLEDYRERIRFALMLYEDRRIVAGAYLGTFVRLSGGITHLMPVVVEKADTLQREDRPIPTDEIGSLALEGGYLETACRKIRGVSDPQREEWFFEMLARIRERELDRLAVERDDRKETAGDEESSLWAKLPSVPIGLFGAVAAIGGPLVGLWLSLRVPEARGRIAAYALAAAAVGLGAVLATLRIAGEE